MAETPKYMCGLSERRVVYAWEGEVDGLRAQVERLEAERAEMLEALRGVVAVVDRKTDEFDRARAIIARADR